MQVSVADRAQVVILYTDDDGQAQATYHGPVESVAAACARFQAHQRTSWKNRITLRLFGLAASAPAEKGEDHA